MINGEVVVAAAALCAASSALVAAGLSPRFRSGGHIPGGAGDAEVRAILFRAIDEGGLAPGVLEALSPTHHRALEAQARALLPSLRGEDRDSLGQLLDRLGTVEAARRKAHSKRAVVRAEAGEFLGESGSRDAVRDLIQLLQDPEPKVRWAAARGLGRIGDASAVPVLLGSLEGAHALPLDVVADAIVDIRDCPVPVLQENLRSPSVATRTLALELLGRFQALAAADDVIELLHHDPSVEVRARAARSLGRMGSPRATGALLPCVSEGPIAMRAQAIWALGEIGAPEAVPLLRATLLGPSHHMGELAADALAAMGPPGLDALAEIAPGQGAAAALATRVLSAHQLVPASA